MSPRPARISREDVLAAALELVDQGGLDRLTMRALGAALGVDPMAVYRMFSGRSAVTAALAEQFWAGWHVPPRDPASTWQDYAITLMSDVRRRLCAHPHLIPVIATHPMSSPAALLVADEAVGRLINAGAPVHAGLGHLVNTLVMLTVASALGEYTPPAGSTAEPGGTHRDGTEQQEASSTDELAELPHLSLLVQQGWTPSFDVQFATALRAIVTGWQVPAEA